MTRTLITEVMVGSASLAIVLYLLPTVLSIQLMLAQAPPDNTNLALVVATLVIALGSYAMIAAYCYGTIIERIGFFCYEAIQSYLEYRRREYL